MIDGIANYAGDEAVEARCHAATAGIDAAIDDMMPVVTRHPNGSILGVLLAAGQPIESIRANIKLAISGGQNEPRDAISGAMVAGVALPSLFETLKGPAARCAGAGEDRRLGVSRAAQPAGQVGYQLSG